MMNAPLLGQPSSLWTGKDHTLSKYFDHSVGFGPFPNGLLEHVADLPKELRHQIYQYIAAWAPATQWPQTKVTPGNLINFARRNKTPLYEKLLPSEPTYGLAPMFPLFPVKKSEAHIQSMFMENCGTLDYYKEVEYDSFANSLKHCMSTKRPEDEWGGVHRFLGMQGASAMISPRHGRLNSQAWLRHSPQYQDFITHISPNLDLDLTCWRGLPGHRRGAAGVRSRAIMCEALDSSCIAISTMLPNLKSIMLFLALTKGGLDIFLSGKPSNYIASIQKLQPSERFEVRYGRRDFVTAASRKEERNRQHLKAEAALDIMLMPDALLQERKKSQILKAEVESEQLSLGLDIDFELGWLTMEGKDGSIRHEAGTFLLAR
ncbi:hypothetical protein BKA64DRAFT_758840 [Cadophora sp. MPI-SDFR-AT-0126]|nr:hypothetical protein BKA64DRAFT_758840 [Leotiomycetes sp. MPI-SDFR-AT-0126]